MSKGIKRYNRVLDSMKENESGRWVDYYEVEAYIEKEIAKQLTLHNVVEIQCDHNWHHLDNFSDRMYCVKCDKRI